MSELLEILDEIDVDNIWVLIALCVLVISTAASYIQLFHASQFEAVLMNKSEESKRFFFVYVILFFVLGVKNYLFTTNSSFCLVNVAILVLTLLVSLIFKLISKIERFKKVYLSFCEGRDFIVLMTFTAAGIFVVSIMININSLILVVLGSLIEVFTIAIAVLNSSKIKTVITVTIEGEKWYVFKRIDEEYLLCGDNCMINDSTKTKLIEIEDIVKDNICFEKEVQETKSQENNSKEDKEKKIKPRKASK